MRANFHRLRPATINIDPYTNTNKVAIRNVLKKNQPRTIPPVSSWQQPRKLFTRTIFPSTLIFHTALFKRKTFSHHRPHTRDRLNYLCETEKRLQYFYDTRSIFSIAREVFKRKFPWKLNVDESKRARFGFEIESPCESQVNTFKSITWVKWWFASQVKSEFLLEV